MKLAKALLCVAILSCSGLAAAQSSVAMIGLITKTDTNPFFMKMKDGAKAEGQKREIRIFTAAGAKDGDTATQITAIERMTNAGINTILIASNGDAILPAVRKAKSLGVQVIALDSPFDGADALFATDNYQAGVLIGRYAKAALGDKPAKIVMLDLFPGALVGSQRHNGFMKGFGLPAADAASYDLSSDAAIVCMADSNGDEKDGQAAMAKCLKKTPEINVVYTINEPAAAGAYKALKAAGREKDVLIVSVDGSCTGVADVGAGRIAATSQQYPLRMAAKGVAAGVEYALSGVRARGFVDTGVALIAAKSLPGVDSKDVKFGEQLCWGKK